MAKRKAASVKTTAKVARKEEPAGSPVNNSNEDILDIQMTKGQLKLEDGTVHEGFSFGAEVAMCGEVVFNTGMVGYPEALTDPSYRGQILVLTFPLIGNYGVPNEEEDNLGLPKAFESRNIHIRGLVVSEYSLQHSHWTSVRSLGDWLSSHGVPALFGVDTRALTKHIREHAGTVLGKLVFPSSPDEKQHDTEIVDPNQLNLVAEVSAKETKIYNPTGSPTVLAYDCGMKFNIIRYLVGLGVKLIVVPHSYDLTKGEHEWDGLFLSNGPGDPTMVEDTVVRSVRWALALEPPKPIFGICLGNQVIALACNVPTFKMKYGNRGLNQPCVDMRTTRCYITPQNHGYAVDDKQLPADWRSFFTNANDLTNEGIIHAFKPFFSVQFHPEACGGPVDTSFLFQMFIDRINGCPPKLTLLDPIRLNRPIVKKILLLGSGGLSIGQAGEFDYSGSQAIKALKEEGLEVVLINPNIATVQTSKGMADKVYFLPLLPSVVTDVLKKERPDSIIVSMGGQTALNIGIKLWEAGVLQENNVKVLGTPIDVIVDTEDRERFSAKLAEINESLALSYPATTVDEAKVAAKKIGYPVLIRAAFALGGLGSGFAANETELVTLAMKAFASSDQILIDQDLRGWKEVEYEVVRDCNDNCITVCNMENFDPLGIHTGDSIVVAPSQTLSNSEYFRLRSTALKVVRHLGVVGECNIQYALDPHSERYCIIEVNARLSRSSALASKATGYPLAYVAAKLSLGLDLVGIRNSVTKTTTACFEPALDYCVVKMPRWDLKKFHRVSTTIGSAMLSVGEVMAIGRSFEESLQKAVRMVNPKLDGLDGGPVEGATEDEVEHQLRNPTDQRLFYVSKAFELGYSVDKVYNLTKIDRWFLHKVSRIASFSRSLQSGRSLDSLDRTQLLLLKQAGFGDKMISRLTGAVNELAVRRRRLQLGVVPVTKQIDTLAAEFPAYTNYLYMTYHGTENDLSRCNNGVMVLGCGAYCIGSSVEFDWCAVSCVRTLRAEGNPAIVVNYNPETVSTDYDESDRLYFEELSFERVLDVYESERAQGVVVSVGGQIPNNLALPLHRYGVNILGTSPESIDKAEDRHKFSALLDSIGVDQPPWRELKTTEDAASFAEEVGYPVLVRPSFVLSGAAMNVATDRESLMKFLSAALDEGGVGDDVSIVVSKFIVNAKEIEFDGVARDGVILNYAMSEHVENAGVHSGDATLVLPAQRLYVHTIHQVKRIAASIAKALNITGPFNCQLMARDNDVKVIECNLRASRTFPFISKTFDFNFISLATKVMMGVPVKPHPIALIDIDYVGVKAPQFSFTRLHGADPTLGVEMASTGEVACFGHDMYEAYLKALLSSGFKLPNKTRNILLSAGNEDMRRELLSAATTFEKEGYNLYATFGTANYLRKRGVKVRVLSKPQDDPCAGTKDEDGSAIEPVVDWLQRGRLDLVINIPDGNKVDISNGYLIRRCAVDFGVSLITNVKCGVLLAQSLARVKELEVLCMDDYYRMPCVGWGLASKHPSSSNSSGLGGAAIASSSPRGYSSIN